MKTTLSHSGFLRTWDRWTQSKATNLFNVGAPHFQNVSTQIWLAAIAACLLAVPWLFLPLPQLPLVLMLSVATLAIGIRYPTLILAAFLCLSLFRIHEVYPEINALRLPLVFSAVALAALAWHVFVTHTRRPFWSFELGALAAFFGIVTFGMIYADSGSLAWASWTDVFSKITVMTIAIAWTIRSPSDFELVARAFVLSGLLVACVAVYNKYSGIGLVNVTRVTVGRDLGGNLGDPNELALLLLIPLSFSLAFVAQDSGPLNRVFGIVAAPAILLATIFTQSRGGLLGLLAVLFVFGARLRSKALLGVLAIVVSVGLYLAMGIPERAADTGGISHDESVLDRLSAWRGAIDMALDRPLTGVGLANFSNSLPKYHPGLSMVAHSTWLGVLAEIGIPGFIAFIVLVAATGRSAVLSRRVLQLRQSGGDIMKPFSTALVAAFAGFCLAASFLSHGFSWPLYVLVGLVAAVSRYALESTLATPVRDGISYSSPVGLADVQRIHVDRSSSQ
jgi:putative inorganic carbon (HCO3(-)) transporter